MAHAVAQIESFDVPLKMAKSSLPHIALFLQNTLTQKLTAYIVGLSDGRDIGRYARGERSPHNSTGIKLRELFSLVSIMIKKEDAETIQVWFQGRNPELQDRSPAMVLRESFDNYPKVKTAIEKFLATGE